VRNSLTAPAESGYAASSGNRRVLRPDERRKLWRYFAEDVERLEALLRLDLARWREPVEPRAPGRRGAFAAGARRALSTVRRTLPERVSVLVPTREAGPRFARTLAALEAQRGIRSVELLVTDSGSTDGTPELARRHGARVVTIPPEDFDHGRTRDELAARAAGDVLVMLVQDAVLEGPRTLRELVLALRREPRLAAVSAMEVPRPDAGLHTRWQSWARRRALESSGAARGRDGRRGAADGGEPVGRRDRRLAKAALDDVCAAIRREAWEEVRFREREFAEDLDFALRARERGWRCRFSTEARVEHSHDRGALYLLARHAMSVQVTAELLGERRRPAAVPGGLLGLAASIRALLPELESALPLAEPRAPGGLTLLEAFDSAREALAAGRRPQAPTGELASLDALLEGPGGSPDRPAPGAGDAEEPRRCLLLALDHPPLLQFAARCTDRLGPAEARSFLEHEAAARLGQMLGHELRWEADTVIGRRLRATVSGSGSSAGERPPG
jgi:rhamnosyltransferase